MDKKILIIRLDRIGDVLLSTPVIKAVRDAYPASHIAFMVRPYARELVKGNPYLNEIITYDKEGRQSGLFGTLMFILQLRRKKFDLAIILHPTNRSHIIAFLAGIPERVGYDRKCGYLLTKRVPHTKHLGMKHEADYTLDMLRYIGIEPSDRTLYMPLNEKSEEKIKNILNRHGITKKDFVIVIHPGASCPSKRWPLESFTKVADDLVERFNARVVVIAGTREKAFADRVANSMKTSPINLAAQTTVGDLGSVLARSRLLISNDSGPVHIACAVGTPVIAIFGRSDRGLSPARWGPGGKHDIVLHKDVGCDVCLAHNCKIGFRCLAAITVEEVLTAADKILSKNILTAIR